MLSALLAGEGLQGIAELAAAEAGEAVAIVLPARGLSGASSGDVELAELSRAVSASLRGDADGLEAAGIEIAAEVEASGEVIGLAVALGATANGTVPRPRVDLDEILRTAALAAVAEVAVSNARDELAANVRGSLLEDLRAGTADPGETVSRAARLGCDLSAGAVALVASVRSAKPRHAAAVITGEYPGAIAEALVSPAEVEVEDGGEPEVRVFALLPSRGGDDAAERSDDAAKVIADRLRPHGPAAFSSFCADPTELPRAISEAELMLDVISRDDRVADQLSAEIGNGVYRLLFRAMATDPDEVRRFYSETVEPLVAHDARYRTDLLGTLETYLANDCNMNATARAVFAHRHTVAHRLGRIRELTGLDPARGDDRERLGLGLKAHRIVAPTLPR
jgi:sugar diacid utilization regulator